MKPKKREHTSITGKTLFGTDADFHLASALPYACVTCADGREVLVNAFLEPIWQRRPRSGATPADPHDPVRDAVFRERIYNDGDRHHEKRAAAKHCLEEFRGGLPVSVVTKKGQGLGIASGGGGVPDPRQRSA